MEFILAIFAVLVSGAAAAVVVVCIKRYVVAVVKTRSITAPDHQPGVGLGFALFWTFITLGVVFAVTYGWYCLLGIPFE
jgi:hypothetical protein